ncbi:PAX-interacting protein 1-like isoform X2 [Drosophila novamexicana]|uniref:PAX-interacting protein 1-like isoform X2 n=1 Tax=Drosophila novamexicana TaxID=47314 RepID=UPI0011E5966F|nr:PAX-interacting protein 1-like isoform X2 [Drosophila novamexicana]
MTVAETEENGPSNSSRHWANAPRAGLPAAQDQDQDRDRDRRLELKKAPNARSEPAQELRSPCAGGQPKVYPTLRLRLRQGVPEAAETDNVPMLVQGPRQAGGRSSSSTSRLARQAVTQPRRVSTPPASTRPVEMMPPPSLSPLASASASASASLSLPMQSPEHSYSNSLGGSGGGSGSSSGSYWLETQHFNVAGGQVSRPLSLPLALPLPLESAGAAERRLTFDQWLQSKKKQEVLRRRQSRREAHRLHSLKQMRKQMSEKCYEDWLHAKRRVHCSARLPGALAEVQRKRREESQLCLAQWQLRKRQEQEQRREEQLRAEQEQRVHEQLRRQLSQLAWERWLAQLAAKNQSNPGLQTERQWQQQQHHLQQQQQFQQQQQHLQQHLQQQQHPLSRLSKLTAAAAPRQRIRLRPPPSSARQQQQQQLDQRKLQEQVASLYLHVPLSAAQRALRRRLDAIDAVHLQRRRR